MRAIAYGTVLAALALGGCWTNRSSAEGFVQDVSVSRRGLVVEYCDISFEVDRHLFELFPHESRDTGTIGVEGCSHLPLLGLSNDQFVPPEPKPQPAPGEILDPNEAAMAPISNLEAPISDTEQSP